MIQSVYNPAAIGLTTDRPVYWNGSNFASVANYAVSGGQFLKSGSALASEAYASAVGTTLAAAVASTLAGYLAKADNLSGLANAGTARTNLGLGTLATQSGTFSGTSSGTNTGDQDLSSYATTASLSSYALLAGRAGGQTLYGDTTSGGNLTLQSTAHATGGVVIVKGKGTQSNNLQEWQTSGASVVAYIGPLGQLTAKQTSLITTDDAVNTLTLTAKSGQSSYLLECKDASAVSNFRVSTNGTIGLGSSFYFQGSGATIYATNYASSGRLYWANEAAGTSSILESTDGNGVGWQITGRGAAVTQFLVKGAASQSANLQEWQNSAGTVLSGVKANGYFGYGTSTALTPFHARLTVAADAAFRFDGLSKDTSTDTEGVGLYLTHNATANRQFVIADTLSGIGVRFIGNLLDGLNVSSGSRLDLTMGTDSSGVGVGAAITGVAFSVVPIDPTRQAVVIRGGFSGLGAQTAVMLQMQGQSSTTSGREQVNLDTAWATSTDASRKARFLLSVWDTSARECIRAEASGSAAMIGLYGVTAVIQPAGAAQAAITNSTGGTADGTLVDVTTIGVADPAKVNDNFTEVYTLLNAMRTAMVNLGSMKGAA